MTLSFLRRVTGAFMVAGIAGMIVFSVRENIGAAMTAGMIAAIAAVCLMTGTAIHVGLTGGGSGDGLAAELEARVEELVNAGVERHAAQSIVRKAVRLGESRRPAT
jgi:hypothetical protein